MDRIGLFTLFVIIVSSCNQTNQKTVNPDDLKLSGFDIAELQTTANFRGISVVDSFIVWVSGSGGTYVRTVDGGNSWNVDSVPGHTDYDFRDIEAFDANTAVMMSAGRPAIIMKTVGQ